MSDFQSINRHQRTNRSPASSSSPTATSAAVYVKLPAAPGTGSPVPHLTSLYHFDNSDEHGSRAYPGNCGGGIIRDLLQFFQPANVFDPMTGSGTCTDVCLEFEIPCESTDLKRGFDATDSESYKRFATQRFDFIWAHPPYWRQKIYSNSPQDLSRAPTLDAFLKRYQTFVRECAALLTPKGKFAILMGDYPDRMAGFVPLTYHTKRLAFDAGLRQACTDIIRFSHGASSSSKTYSGSFIPTPHDTCMIFEKRVRSSS